uniref:DUF4376 domain-containing protein n=1 Tax=Candidatus Kentrum sp. UNK TaxID=2126344 RepID=A0A450ZYM5_9GAMM|nr:MAG: protein of unknown function (DUF4376) [Candidatus Kentron sp. UNK]VFK68603.1 MAG: protein of unknown function (DUF4376) [Candidatus Kentron sp. UNK]
MYWVIDTGTSEYLLDGKGKYLREEAIILPMGGGIAKYEHQTNVPPIPRGKVGEFETVILQDGSPEIQEDHRGRKLYSTMDGSSVEMKEIGPLPNGVTDKERPSPLHDWNQEEGGWAPNRHRILQAKLAEIKTQLKHRLEKGGFEAFGTWHSSSQRASTQIVAMRQSIHADKFQKENWITLLGEDTRLKKEDVEEIYEGGAQRTREIYAAFRAHKARILGFGSDTEKILLYDTSKDWPMSFEEYLASEREKLRGNNDNDDS